MVATCVTLVWQRVKKILNWSHEGRRYKVKFRCCDSCGVGFGVTEYPDGNMVQPEKEPRLVKIARPYIELCTDCYKRYKNDMIRIGELTKRVREYYRFLRKKKRLEERRRLAREEMSKKRQRATWARKSVEAREELRRKFEAAGRPFLDEGQEA